MPGNCLGCGLIQNPTNGDLEVFPSSDGSIICNADGSISAANQLGNIVENVEEFDRQFTAAGSFCSITGLGTNFLSESITLSAVVTNPTPRPVMVLTQAGHGAVEIESWNDNPSAPANGGPGGPQEFFDFLAFLQAGLVLKTSTTIHSEIGPIGSTTLGSVILPANIIGSHQVTNQLWQQFGSGGHFRDTQLSPGVHRTVQVLLAPGDEVRVAAVVNIQNLNTLGQWPSTPPPGLGQAISTSITCRVEGGHHAAAWRGPEYS